VADAVRDGETGLLVDPESPAAVAVAVNRLLTDEPLRRRMGAAGRTAVETYFNWERVSLDFLRIDAEFRRRR
jgi:glycosyltransferase involved in cell wall biosynthesis